MITFDIYVITDPCGDEHKLRETHIVECDEHSLPFVYQSLLNCGYKKNQIIIWKFRNTIDLVFKYTKPYKIPICNE